MVVDLIIFLVFSTFVEIYQQNEHERRFAIERCCLTLPWEQTLVNFKKDSSLHVQKSVANNLNDISKIHPELVGKLQTFGMEIFP